MVANRSGGMLAFHTDIVAATVAGFMPPTSHRVRNWTSTGAAPGFLSSSRSCAA